jgi:uncharacterized protein YbaR (Trm112 family)
LAGVPASEIAIMKHTHEFGVTLVCPDCRAEVVHLSESFVCRSADCRRAYPIVDGIPKFLVDDACVLPLNEWRQLVPQNGEAESIG